jgi:hypothetical protein
MTGAAYDALSWAGRQPACISVKDATQNLNRAIIGVKLPPRMPFPSILIIASLGVQLDQRHFDRAPGLTLMKHKAIPICPSYENPGGTLLKESRRALHIRQESAENAFGNAGGLARRPRSRCRFRRS